MPTRSGREFNRIYEMSDRDDNPVDAQAGAVGDSENMTAENSENMNVEASAGNGQVALDPLQLQYLLQQQQIKLLQEQRRVMELNVTEKPILSSLLPEDVNNFLTQWEVYENTLQQMMGISEPMIQPCIKITLMTELKALGTDVSDRASILQTFTDLRNQDHEARKHFLVEKIKNDVVYVNRGNIPASMRSYLLAVDEIKQGIELDTHTEKMLCEAVLGNLPTEFLQGTVKETQSRRQWKKYNPMKKDLIEDTQTLARYSLTAPKLRIGVADTRPNIRKRSGPPGSYNRRQVNTGNSGERQRLTQNYGNTREPQRRFGGSSNQQAADALADLKRRIARDANGTRCERRMRGCKTCEP